MQTCTTTSEKSLVVSHTVKHKFTIGSINSTPKHLFKRNEDMWTHTDLFIAALFIITIN